jgi:hypothetical protein
MASKARDQRCRRPDPSHRVASTFMSGVADRFVRQHDARETLPLGRSDCDRHNRTAPGRSLTSVAKNAGSRSSCKARDGIGELAAQR